MWRRAERGSCMWLSTEGAVCVSQIVRHKLGRVWLCFDIQARDDPQGIRHNKKEVDRFYQGKVKSYHQMGSHNTGATVGMALSVA
jgi:hypothetical protein